MYVSDTARAIALLGSHDEAIGATVNLGSGKEVSIRELCELVLAAVGRTELAPLHLDARPGDVRRLLGNAAYMHRLTGFAPRVSLRTGIERLVQWIQDQPGTPEEKLKRVSDRNWEAESA